MNEKEQHQLKTAFSYRTGMQCTIELIYSDVVIIPGLQALDLNCVKAIGYWIEDMFTVEGADTYEYIMPKLTLIPQGQTRYEMGVRVSQTLAVRMMKLNGHKF